MLRQRLILIVALLAGMTAACDSVESELGDDVEFVVEAYLEAGSDPSPVRLTRAADINASFSARRQGVIGADVRIHLLGSGGSIEETYRYDDVTGEPGVYETDSKAIIQPLREYRLEVDAAGAPRTITSTTLVPGDFQVVREGLDAVVYQRTPQYEIGVTRSAYPGRQAIFIFSVEALEPSFETLTPFYEEVVDNDEDIFDDVVVVESGIVNEGNYEVLEDGTINVKLPWIGVAFYGPQRVSISVIDDNVHDFVRSQFVQQGGSTLSPGEIPNVIDHVEGGLGIFGSYVRTTRLVTVNRSSS